MPTNSSTPALSIAALSQRFGRQWAIRDLDLEVPRGCVFGFLGLNGAGKSTTIRTLMGFLAPTAGSVRTLGLDPITQGAEVKRHVGYVPDDPALYDWMTVEETEAFVAYHRQRQWDAAYAERLHKAFELPSGKKVGSLSKGQRARLSLLLAMAFRPEMLLLDEPTGGLDPLARRQFFEGMLGEYLEGGQTVFISSHLITEIAGLVDRLGIVHEGRLLWTGRTEEYLARWRRVRLAWEGDAPDSLPAIPGLARMRHTAREIEVWIDGYDEATHQPIFNAMGVQRADTDTVGLEDAFVELVRGRDSQ